MATNRRGLVQGLGLVFVWGWSDATVTGARAWQDGALMNGPRTPPPSSASLAIAHPVAVGVTRPLGLAAVGSPVTGPSRRPVDAARLVFLTLLATLLAVALTACGRGESPIVTIDKIDRAFDRGDFVEASSHFEGRGLAAVEDAPELQPMFAAIQLDPKRSSGRGNTAQVTVDVTGVDLRAIMASLLGDAFAAAFMGREPDMAALIAEQLENGAPQVRSTVDVNMVREDGKWLVAQENGAFFEAMFGLRDLEDALTGR